MILSERKVKKCLLKDDINGDIVLGIVVKEIKYSRIWSMLKFFDSSEYIVEILNEKGCLFLYFFVSFLKGDVLLFKVECCIRVIILFLYGVSFNN